MKNKRASNPEVKTLEAALARAQEGHGQVVGIVADPGTGKSRLCFEFLERCRARGITVRTATGVPHGRAVPLQPILEFYREVFGSSPDDSDAQTRQKIAGSVAQIAPEELPSLPLLFDFMQVPDPAQPPPNLTPDERLRTVILEGGPAVGLDVAMAPNPDLRTKPEVLDALVEHVRSLPRGAG